MLSRLAQVESRLLPLAEADGRLAVREWLALVLAGAAAGIANVAIDLRLGIPGHAIVRSVFPMAFGLALVPRRGSGTVMSGIATTVAGLLSLVGGFHLSPASTTGLVLVGPLIDLAARGNLTGWRLHVRFALAGLTANAAAYIVKLSCAALGWAPLGRRSLEAFWLPAIATYSVCGAVAGLLSAAVWFRFATRQPRHVEASDS